MIFLLTICPYLVPHFKFNELTLKGRMGALGIHMCIYNYASLSAKMNPFESVINRQVQMQLPGRIYDQQHGDISLVYKTIETYDTIKVVSYFSPFLHVHAFFSCIVRFTSSMKQRCAFRCNVLQCLICHMNL